MSRIFQQIALKIQGVFNRFDVKAHGAPLSFSEEKRYPIFIIGAPRSGSTLLYQLFVKHTRVAYISNLMSLIPSHMVTLARLTNRCHRHGPIRESRQGYISGLFSPSEAGAVQRKWFEEAFSTDAVKIRNTVIQISRCFSGPFLSKNLMNSLRLSYISSVFPEARFIHIRRDPMFNAQSLLLSRIKTYGSDDQWWSVKPEGYEKTLDLSPKYQVVWQIFKIEEMIASFLEAYSSVDFATVSYENLCLDTKKEIEQIAEKFQMEVRRDHGFLEISEQNKIRVSQEEWEEMKRYCLQVGSGEIPSA